ncbi:glycosyltransferase [Deinococcus sp. PESE-13]
MKILIAVAAFPPSTLYGGPATVAQQHAEVLSRRGHDVTVLTTDVDLPRGTTPIKLPHILVRLPAAFPGKRLPLLSSVALPKWLRRHLPEFHVVHVHFAREIFPVTVAQMAWQAHVPYVLQPHGMVSSNGGLRDVVDLLWTRRLLRDAGAVAALQDVEEQALAKLEARAHIVQVPNGMSIIPQESVSSARRQGEAPIILFLARLHPRKRVLDFVRMAAQLTQQGRDLRFRVVGPDGGEREAAEELVRELGLQARFVFTGALAPAQARHEMQAASIYVLPSVEEPFPMTVLEALSLGTPVVGTSTLHIRDLLVRADAVQIADPALEAPKGLAQAVATLLDDPTRSRAQATHGQRLMSSHLTLDRVAERLEEAYLYACTRPTGY